MSLGNRHSLLWMTLSASAALATGCSSAAPSTGSAPSEPSTAQEAAALDAPNGGLDLTSKEAPAFGDPEIEALPVMQAPPRVAESQPADPTSASTAAPGLIGYRLMLVWGHLPPPSDKTSTDVSPVAAQWAGAVTVAGGTLSVLKTIAFDSTGDAVGVASGPSVSFTSQTGAYVDGLLLRVLVPAGAAPTVHFATSLVTADLDLARLGDSPGGIVRSADGVSGLGWIGFPEGQCVRGFVLGRWIKDQPNLGRALGVVSDSGGGLLGYVRGAWGYAPGRSDEVWFDKYIDTAGNPKGLAFGSYGDGALDGLFAATDEHDVDALGVGPTEGFYSDGLETGDGRSVWMGRWSAPCVP